MRKRRKSAMPDDATPETEEVPAPDVEVEVAGPFDSADVDLEQTEHIDLGSLRIIPCEGTELRLQVDEESGAVMAVLIVAEDGAVELRAFAASRAGDLWTDTRREIAADTAQRGGTASQSEGVFGTELQCMLPVTGPNGESMMQPSKVIGINGPRWFLRASVLGEPATVDPLPAAWEQVIRAVVVHRGTEAMPPGEALPLRLPPEAKRVE